MDLGDVQTAINSAKRASGEATKTASATSTGGFNKQAALKKEAETLLARGRLMAQGFVTEVLTQADNLMKQALNEGGKINGSKITESGSLMADGGNALPTNKENPGKSKIDETGVKHLKETDSIAPHDQVAVHKSEARINKVSK